MDDNIVAAKGKEGAAPQDYAQRTHLLCMSNRHDRQDLWYDGQ